VSPNPLAGAFFSNQLKNSFVGLCRIYAPIRAMDLPCFQIIWYFPTKPSLKSPSAITATLQYRFLNNLFLPLHERFTSIAKRKRLGDRIRPPSLLSVPTFQR
jgi:hypothetical protein